MSSVLKAILQKRPVILRSLLIIATLYQILVLCVSFHRALLAFHRALLAMICDSISCQKGLFPHQNIVLRVTFHEALLAFHRALLAMICDSISHQTGLFSLSES